MIDWDLLTQSLARAGCCVPGRVVFTRVHGGDINQSFCLQVGDRLFFVKLNQAHSLTMFEAERAGLESMRATSSVRVPEVYLTGCQAGTAYIVMEFVELSGKADAEKLAACLATMHGCFHDRFGYERDNTIGSTAQVNTYSDSWIEFWRNHRLGFQLQLAARNNLDKALVDAGNRLCEDLQKFLGNRLVRPSLVHGDLWSGNQGFDPAGQPVVFDPACYYGDHEVDLAMMELFGQPGERFFARYRELFPIDSGYPVRRELYNLYHVLNHANLFGGGYVIQAKQMIEHLRYC